MIMVGKTPCRTAPKILKKSPASHITMNTTDRPSAELLLQFSIICGEKTTVGVVSSCGRLHKRWKVCTYPTSDAD
jgi:hypothetical protein